MRKFFPLAVMFMSACFADFGGVERATDAKAPVYDAGADDATEVEADAATEADAAESPCHCGPDEFPAMQDDNSCVCQPLPSGNDAGASQPDTAVPDTSQAPCHCAPGEFPAMQDDGTCCCQPLPSGNDAGASRPDTSVTNDCDPGFERCPDIMGDDGCYLPRFCEATDAGHPTPGVCPAGSELIGYTAGGYPYCVCEREGHDCHWTAANTCSCDPVTQPDAGTTQPDAASNPDAATQPDAASNPDAATQPDSAVPTCEPEPGYTCEWTGSRCNCVRETPADAGLPAPGVCPEGSELIGYTASGFPYCACEREGYECAWASNGTCDCDPLPGTDAGTPDPECQREGYVCQWTGTRCDCLRDTPADTDAGTATPDAATDDPVCERQDMICHLSDSGQCLCDPIPTTDAGVPIECEPEPGYVCRLDAGACLCDRLDVPEYCPDHSFVNQAGVCECNEGWHMVYDGQQLWCEPGSSGSTACDPGMIPAGDGWCTLFVPEYQVLSSHPCDGQDPSRACFLDKVNHDNLTETLCIQGFGLVQRESDNDNQGAPFDPAGNNFTEYLEDMETARSYSQEQGHLYAFLPAYAVGPNEQSLNMAPDAKDRAYIQDGYVCKDFSPLGNFRFKVGFVSQYSRFKTLLSDVDSHNRVNCHLVMGTGVDDSYVSCPDYDSPQDPEQVFPLSGFQSVVNGIRRCLITEEKDGEYPIGICPIKADGTYGDQAWHHLETFCASPEPNTLEGPLCLGTEYGYWLKVARDYDFGLATWQ